MTAEAIRQRNQIRAVVLFACAILLACLVLIQGDNLWSWAHGAILGIFGSWALLWPVLMIYVAVVTALDKPRGSIGGKVWLTVLVIVLFCTTGFIFSAKPVPEGLNFGQYISYLYLQNPGTSGGVVGGLLGQPLLQAAGDVGAKIIILLMLFVALMVLTGTTLVGLFRTIKKPVDVVSEGIQNAKQRREEERLILEKALYTASEQMKNTYCFPPISMLAASKQANPALETEELQTNGRILVETLKSFGVQTKILDICRGPSVTRYEIQPAAGVKISKITNLADDLALNLAAAG